MKDDKANKIKEQQPVTMPSENSILESKKEFGKFWVTVRKVFSGEFFTHEKLKNHYAFLFFIAFIAFVYIANTSYAERNNSRIYKSKKELNELKLEYAPLKTRMTILEKQSTLKTKLKDTTIKESVDPIRIIKIEEK